MAIHACATVDPTVEIGDGVEVGPWCVVGPGVLLRDGVSLVSHVVVQQDSEIGARTVIHPFAVIGGDPQHGGYKGEPVRLVVGEDCVIREHTTLNRGTPGGGGVTTIGDGCLLMAGSHVGHDASLGNRVTFANGGTVGGHVSVGEGCFLGGMAAVHQFGRVGRGAMIGGLAAVTRDVIPFGSAWGNHARLHGLNMVGLKRRGFDKDRIRAMLAFYRDLFEGDGAFSERVERARSVDIPEAQEIVAFIEGGKRPLCLPEA